MLVEFEFRLIFPQLKRVYNRLWIAMIIVRYLKARGFRWQITIRRTPIPRAC